MSEINQLSQLNPITGGDQIPIFSTANGDARRASMTAVKEFVQEDFVPSGGILAISGVYSMRRIPLAPVTLAIATTNTIFTNYDSPALISPADRTSIAPMVTLGEFVMQRDVAAIHFWVALTGTWPTNRDLTIAVLLGTDALPTESGSKFIGAGRGANLISATLASPAVNFNNPGGTIKAGEKVKLVARMNVADNFDLTRLAFVVQTWDGP